jgi:dihydrofolate synthase/folylpolyglutamate synthase
VESDVRLFDTPAAAFGAAREAAQDSDRIVAFGSFRTVADVLASMQATRH